MTKKKCLTVDSEVTVNDEALRKKVEKLLGPPPWLFEGTISSKGGLRQHGTQKTLRIPLDKLVPLPKQK